MIIDHDGNEFDSTIELPSAVVTSALKSLDIPHRAVPGSGRVLGEAFLP